MKPNFVELTSEHFNGGAGDKVELYDVAKFIAKLYDEWVTKPNGQLPGIVRPEGERPYWPYELDKRLKYAQRQVYCNSSPMMEHYWMGRIDILNELIKEDKAAAQEGEPLPAEGEAEANRCACPHKYTKPLEGRMEQCIDCKEVLVIRG